MKRDAWIIIGLIAITLLAFARLGQCDFVKYDDFAYVVDNPHVTGGLTIENFKWAWTNLDHNTYIPLTWLSLQLDATLFHSGPHGFHWVNLAFHIANAILVYLFFRQATSAVWRSALIAAIFAVHPLRVESVAWVAERKDVLSGFFALLAMLAYLQYVRRTLDAGRDLSRRTAADESGRRDKSRPTVLHHHDESRPKWWYLGTILLFTASLLAKQSLTTLPILLLLLDYWPLGRWAAGPAAAALTQPPRRSLIRLIAEKLPLLAVAAILGALTVKSQHASGNNLEVQVIPLPQRLANIPVAYVRYLGKMVWFSNLAVLYPPHQWSTVQVGLCCILLAAITGLCLWKLRSWPWLTVGWLWFLGVLVPMIGIVQFGHVAQALADRFTYFSGIGLLLMAVWSIPQAAWRNPVAGVAAVSAVLCALIAFTLNQTGYWHDTLSLFTHDANVDDSATAELNIGGAMAEQKNKDIPQIISHLEKAVAFDPGKANAQASLAKVLARNGEIAPAIDHYARAAAIEPKNPKWRPELALLLVQSKRYNQAIPACRAAIDLNPRSADMHRLLGVAFCEIGKTQEGLNEFKLALLLKPEFEQAKVDLAHYQHMKEKSD